jgi:hypothetical protein
MSLILTKAGLAAYAQAEATGIKLQATHMAVGDGNGEAVAHTSDSLVLVNEVWRGALQEITVAPSGEVEFIAHVPVTVGGWYIRELAVYGADTLLAVGAHPELWKPDPTAPDKVELEITAPIKFDNAATLNLVVDTTKVLASQSHVAGKIAEHDAAPEAHGDLLADKADVGHTHAMADVSGLGAALAGKAEVGHGHEEYALAGHTHPIIPTIETDYIDASALLPTEDGGAASGVIATATHGQRYGYRDMGGIDSGTAVETTYPMPESWDRGPIKIKAVWTTGSELSTSMQLLIQAAAIGDGESLDVDFGEGVVLWDTVMSLDAVHVSGASPALTVEGAPALGDLIHLRITRAAAGQANCQLMGIWIQYTCNRAVTGW